MNLNNHTKPARTMKITNLLLTASLAFVLFPVSSMGYTAWANAYDGTSDNTIVLYHFNQPAESLTDSNAATGASSLGTANILTNIAHSQVGVSGKFDLAFQSDSPKTTANEGYAQLGNGGAFGSAFATSELSVEFWFKPFSSTPWSASGGLGYLVDHMYTLGGTTGFSMYFINNAGQVRVDVGNGTSGLTLSTSDLTWEADTWTHLAFTYEDGVGLKLFQDGNNVASVTSTDFGSLGADTHNLRLGNRLGSGYGSQPGVFDEFRISNVAYDYTPVPEASQSSMVVAAFALVLALGFLRRRRR